MKIKVLSAAVLLAAMLFTACNNKKETNEQEAVTEIVDTTATALENEVATDTISFAKPKHKDGEVIEITGEVTEINQGKDGYTAKLKTAEGKAFAATISIPNLDNPKQYRAVKAGDKITVKGEVTNLESDVLIIVRELK